MLPSPNEIETLKLSWSNHRPDAIERTKSINRRCASEIARYHRHVTLHPGDLTAAQTFRREKLKTDAEWAQKCLVLADKIVAEHNKRLLPANDEGPLAATIARLGLEQNAIDGPRRPYVSRLTVDPVLSLHSAGKISDDDLHDAREIAGIFRRITARVSARTVRYDCLSEPGEEGVRFLATDDEEHYLLLHARVYRPWTETISKEDLTLTLGLVVEALSLHALRTKYKRSADTILKRIKGALEAYRKSRGNHYRGEVGQALAAA